MSSVVIAGNTSGSITLAAPDVAGTTTLTLPATSGTFITTASSGQSIPKAALPTGSVLQVVSTTKSDTFTSSAASTWTDITGMSVSITPTSSTSRIFVQVNLQGNLYRVGANACMVRMLRNSTPIGVGDAAGSRSQVSFGSSWVGSDSINTAVGLYLDSPATTSSTTYKIQFWQDTPANPIFINRSTGDTDVVSRGRSISTITVMEIAA